MNIKKEVILALGLVLILNPIGTIAKARILKTPEKMLLLGLGSVGAVWWWNKDTGAPVPGAKGFTDYLYDGTNTVLRFAEKKPYVFSIGSILGLYGGVKLIKNIDWITSRSVTGIALGLGYANAEKTKAQYAFAEELLKELCYWSEKCNYLEVQKKLANALPNLSTQISTRNLSLEESTKKLNAITEAANSVWFRGLKYAVGYEPSGENPQDLILLFDERETLVEDIKVLFVVLPKNNVQAQNQDRSLVAIIQVDLSSNSNGLDAQKSKELEERLKPVRPQFEYIVDVAIAFYNDRKLAVKALETFGK